MFKHFKNDKKLKSFKEDDLRHLIRPSESVSGDYTEIDDYLISSKRKEEKKKKRPPTFEKIFNTKNT